MRIKFLPGLMIAAAFGFATMRSANAETIDTASYLFQSLDDLALNGTGLGNYNVILYENALGGNDNTGGSVNVDNSNTLLPTGNISTSQTLYWMTSVADLQAFYTQQFPNTPINNIVLFLDINETGQTGETVTFSTLSIYQNATTIPSLDPTGSNDLTSAQQQSITGFTSGTLLAQLSTATQSLDQRDTGQGVDDWSIFTFIDPFDPSLLPTDTLLFQIMMTDLAAGGELLSISGTFSACDISPQGCGTTSSGTTSGTTDGGTTSGTTDGTSTTTTGSSTTTSGTTDGTSTTTTGSTSGDSTGSSTTTGTGSSGTNSTGVTTGTSGDSSGSTEIPEPASFLLLGAGLVAVARMTRKKGD